MPRRASASSRRRWPRPGRRPRAREHANFTRTRARVIRSIAMAKSSIGWIGAGRMGYPMIERLLKADHDVVVWNRTRAKAEPLSQKGARLVDKPSDLSGCEIVFSIVSTGKDCEEVLFGKDGLLTGGKKPNTVVDCSSISVEESAAIRRRLKDAGVNYIAAPVSGNAKVIKAGKLSAVVSGPEADAK
ncbi:MAG TPA: NAD(P)-dependent oxidoreductase, partial [Pseudolabrys sp.]|nr:NAD(P)-dependent oxidoreductase [Pseudolabrys sp.]